MHLRQHGMSQIGVIVYQHVGLSVVDAMQAASILCERPAPGDWHRQEQRVEAGIIEPFADVTARPDKYTLLVIDLIAI
jgi:hypothetical protein